MTILLALALSLLVPATALAISISQTFQTPPTSVTTEIDSDLGLLEILVTRSENADTVVPPFVPGTVDPVDVVSTLINALGLGRIELRTREFGGLGVPDVVTVFDFEFDRNGIVAQAVPMPPAVALLAVGFAAIAFVAWRRR